VSDVPLHLGAVPIRLVVRALHVGRGFVRAETMTSRAHPDRLRCGRVHVVKARRPRPRGMLRNQLAVGSQPSRCGLRNIGTSVDRARLRRSGTANDGGAAASGPRKLRQNCGG